MFEDLSFITKYDLLERGKFQKKPNFREYYESRIQDQLVRVSFVKIQMSEVITEEERSRRWERIGSKS